MPSDYAMSTALHCLHHLAASGRMCRSGGRHHGQQAHMPRPTAAMTGELWTAELDRVGFIACHVDGGT